MTKTTMPELASVKRWADYKFSYKEQNFIREMQIDGDPNAAALRAGYAPGSFRQSAWQLMRKDHIRAALAELKRLSAQKTGVTADRILAEMGRMALWDIRDLFHSDGKAKSPDELGDELAAAVTSATKTITKDGETHWHYILADKGKAIDQLAKHFGLFSPLQVNVQHDITGLSDGQLAAEIQALTGKLGKLIDEQPGDAAVLIDAEPYDTAGAEPEPITGDDTRDA